MPAARFTQPRTEIYALSSALILLLSLSHLLSDGGADVGAGLEHHGVTAIAIAVEADLGDGLAQLGVGPLEDVAVIGAPQDVRRLK